MLNLKQLMTEKLRLYGGLRWLGWLERGNERMLVKGNMKRLSNIHGKVEFKHTLHFSMSF